MKQQNTSRQGDQHGRHGRHERPTRTPPTINRTAADRSVSGITIVGARPCPFCGGEPQIQASGDLSWVRCAECGAITSGKSTIKAAVDSWERRAGE